MYEQREIVLVPFPFTNLESAKLRPALIISNNKLNESSDRICVQITSKQGSLIELNEKYLTNALPARSWIKTTKIFIIHEKLIKRTISKVNEEFHKKVVKELNTYLY